MLDTTPCAEPAAREWVLALDLPKRGRPVRPPSEALLLNRGVRARIFGRFEDGITLAAALADYGRLGEACFAKLRGQFALFIWDEPRATVWVVRDPMGAHPLFYARTEVGFVFASGLAPLLKHPSVGAGFNLLAMADFFRDSWPSLDETFNEQARRVPPGHALRLTSDGEATCERYWLRRDEPVRWLSDEELAGFDRVFDQAVRRSLGERRTGIFLSGGLDSVAVAARSADLTAAAGQPSMHAMSLVFPEAQSDESGIQRAVAGQLGFSQWLAPLGSTIDHPGGILAASLECSARLDSPILNLWLPAYLGLAEEGKSRGCDTILTGTGGDEWLGLTPILGADLIASGQLRDWARLLGLRWRSSFQGRTWRAVWNLAWHYSLRPVLRRHTAAAMRGLAPGWLSARRRRRALDQMPAWLLPDPALRRELADRSEQFDEAQDESRDPSFYLEELRQSLDHPLASLEAEEWFQAYAPLGVRVRHPFYDADLVEFLMRLSPEQLLAPGRSKGMVRGALERRFPQLGFKGQRKVEASNYFTSALRGLHKPAPTGQADKFPALAALGVVDPRKLPDLAGGGYREHYYFWSLLNMEAWLRPRI